MIKQGISSIPEKVEKTNMLPWEDKEESIRERPHELIQSRYMPYWIF